MELAMTEQIARRYHDTERIVAGKQSRAARCTENTSRMPKTPARLARLISKEVTDLRPGPTHLVFIRLPASRTMQSL